MTTGHWKIPGVPHKGWTCVETRDVRADDPTTDLSTCEMCEVQKIRYVHRMQHSDTPQMLDVGCVCAEKMEDDYATPRRREAAVRSRPARRARWLKRKWHIDWDGNEYVTSYGFRVTIEAVNGGWGGIIVRTSTGRKRRSKAIHPNVDAAKLAAFDSIEIFRSKK